MFRNLLLPAALLCLGILPAMAQDDALLTPNRLSVGGGALVGVNSYSAPLLSVMYSRTFAQGLDVELSFQNGASSRFSSTDLTHTVVSSNYNSLGFVNLSNLDATLLWTPSATRHGFRIGLGPTLQYRQFGYVSTFQGSTTKNPPDSLLRVYPPSYYQYSEGWVLGGNLKLEYLFAITNVFDVGVRTQAHVLLLRLNNSDAVRIFADGSAAASLVLGVRF
jgi:hypothetical protein